MKKLLTKLAVASLVLSAPSFAIFGLGAHYAPAFHTIDAKTSSFDLSSPSSSVKLIQGEVSDMQGFGFKLWIDIIPVIDIEASMNMNWANYSADLQFVDDVAGESAPVSLSPDYSFAGLAVPNYFQTVGDFTVNYPFDLIPMITPYVGAGVSYFAGTKVADADFVKSLMDKNPTILDDMETNPEAVSKEVADQLVSDGFSTAIGGHVQAGVRFKPVIIPFAIYANTKYYIGNLQESVHQGALFELGGGLAF